MGSSFYHDRLNAVPASYQLRTSFGKSRRKGDVGAAQVRVCIVVYQTLVKV